jgi:hypothetical protein
MYFCEVMCPFRIKSIGCMKAWQFRGSAWRNET